MTTGVVQYPIGRCILPLLFLVVINRLIVMEVSLNTLKCGTTYVRSLTSVMTPQSSNGERKKE